MPRNFKKRKNFKRNQSHGPPNKKRRRNEPQNKLSASESKSKCLEIIETLKEALNKSSLNLMELTKTTESDVGIKIFINDTTKSHKPIITNLKHKYEDFIVSEIDESGNAVKLTNDESIDQKNAFDQDTAHSLRISKFREEISTVIDQENTQNFLKWYKNALKLKHDIDIEIASDDIKMDKEKEENDDDDDNDEDIDIDINDNKTKSTKSQKHTFLFPSVQEKEKRTLIHQKLKYLQYLQSKTNDDQRINVELTNSKKRRDERWPKTRGSYLKFILTKCGMDTTHCLNSILSKLYKKSNKIFSIAGTKDKHAVTSQYVTAYHITSDQLINAANKLKQIKVGNFEYVSEQIKLGSLTGNRFKIVLRNIAYFNHDEDGKEKESEIPTETELNERLNILKNMGFINYFGMQRFGSSTVGTHDIGRAIVSDNLPLAVALLILPRSNESPDFAQKRKSFLETGDINDFPFKLNNEKKCLYGLIDDSNNYQQAFMKMARNMRTMYIHSYQSYIWNHCVSHRIETYGYKPVIGDLVRKHNKENNDKNNIGDNFEFITNDNLDKYSIFDVVFPLPTSADAKLPKIDTTQKMIELLNNDGLELQHFAKLHKSWGLGENYRNIMMKPIDIEGNVKEYENDNQLLVELPFDAEANSNKNNNNNANDSNSNSNNKEEKENKNEKKKIGWIVEFGLPKSCYATMCIRQLLFISSHKLKR